MNGHLAGQSHVADDLSSIVEGIDETICPYRTSCAAEVAQVLHLAVLPKEVVNLWRPRVCVNRVTLYKTFLRLDHGHSHTSPSYPVHPASPAGASHHAATRSRGSASKSAHFPKPRIERGSEVPGNDDLGSGWIVATRK